MPSACGWLSFGSTLRACMHIHKGGIERQRHRHAQRLRLVELWVHRCARACTRSRKGLRDGGSCMLSACDWLTLKLTLQSHRLRVGDEAVRESWGRRGGTGIMGQARRYGNHGADLQRLWLQVRQVQMAAAPS
eukprot:352586-Chlamydomonas_euryale.AAC.4